MATVKPAVSNLNDDSVLIVWAGMSQTNSDAEACNSLSQYDDRSVQITGDFGTTGNIALHGSNDNTNYVILNDPLGNLINFGVTGLKQVLEYTRSVKPVLSTPDGSTNLTVTMIAKRKRI